MIKAAFDTYLSDALLRACAGFWLFVFVCMFVTPEHVVALWEGNLIILTLEVMVSALAVTWATRRVVHNIKRGHDEA